MRFTLCAVAVCLSVFTSAHAIQLDRHKAGIHKDSADEHAKLLPKPATATPPAGGTASGQPGATGSGSSEHSSIRGTINAGGDFIAPKLQDKEKPKPRGVAPKAR